MKKRILNNFIQSSELLYLITSSNIKKRYGNYLGFLWSFSNPIVLATTYFLVFKIFLRIEVENYVVFLLSGLFPWLFFTSSIYQMLNSFTGNQTLIKKIRFRRYLLMISSVLFEIFNFLPMVIVLLIFFYFNSTPLYLSWILLIPFLIFIQSLFSLSLGITLGTFFVFNKRIENLVNITIQILFFLSPILYPIKKVPENLLVIYNLNPMVYLLNLWRNLINFGTINFYSLIIILTLTFLFSIIGIRIYLTMNKDMVENL